MKVTVAVVKPLTIAGAVTVFRQPLHGRVGKLASGLASDNGVDVLSAGLNVTTKAGSVSVEGVGNAMAFTVIVIVPAFGEVPETVGVVETSCFVDILIAYGEMKPLTVSLDVASASEVG